MARVFVLVLAIGLVPLALGAILIQRASHAEQRPSTCALDQARRFAAYFEHAVALLTAANPVFADFYVAGSSAQTRAQAGRAR